MNTNLFPARLKSLRKSKNITLDELAKSIGTTKVTLSRYESGDRSPKLEIVANLSKYFGVEMTWLSGVDESDNDNSSSLLSQLQNITNKLTPERQRAILDFAKYQYSEQQKSNNS